MIPLPYKLGAALLLCLSAYALGRFHGASEVRQEVDAAEARTEALAAKLQAKQANQTVKVVTGYVDRIQRVEVRVPVVRDRLISVCNKAGSSGVPSGTGNPHAPPASDAPDRRADQLAADLISCRRIKETLTSLQEWKRAHGG